MLLEPISLLAANQDSQNLKEVKKHHKASHSEVRDFVPSASPRTVSPGRPHALHCLTAPVIRLIHNITVRELGKESLLYSLHLYPICKQKRHLVKELGRAFPVLESRMDFILKSKSFSGVPG